MRWILWASRPVIYTGEMRDIDERVLVVLTGIRKKIYTIPERAPEWPVIY